MPAGRWFLLTLLQGGLGFGAAAEARAQTEVDVALVLAIDASGSVDEQEFRQQVSGIASAFLSERVIQAIEGLPSRTIAVAVTHWAKAGEQVVSVPWTLIDGALPSMAFAADLADIPRQTSASGTSISAAVNHGLTLLDQCPCAADKRVIDVSGDGRNNTGPDLEASRADAAARGVTVNGLAVLNDVATLHYYYEKRVIVGPAAFVEVADTFDDYADAIERKLLRELNPAVALLFDAPARGREG